MASLRQPLATMVAVLALAASWLPATADASTETELKVKAAFLFNFARFVTWPPPKSKSAEPMVLCVTAHEGLMQALQDTVADKTLHGRPIQVRELQQPDQLRPCHVAYVGALDAGALAVYLAAGAGHSVLTVHEGDTTLKHGVIRFFIRDNRVNFEINTAAAAREELQVSSKLLSVAALTNL